MLIVAIFSASLHTSWLNWPAHFVAGFSFAFLREWRGSLAAPIVAHALQNGWAYGFIYWS